VGQLEIGGSQETLGQFPDSGPICETGNPSLTELGSLESLVEFQEITIGQNQNLGSIEELRGLAERIGMKPDGEIPRIMLNENERLPIDHIRDVLQDGHDGGAYRLETYCNEGEEACESWCH
jgi:hypothetical protein